MGNQNCAGARERAAEYGEKSKQYYIQAKEKTIEAAGNAKVKYAA